MRRPRRFRAGVPVLALSAALALAAGCDRSSGSREAFCAKAQDVAASNPATVFDRYDPTDPAAASGDLEAAAAQLRELEEAAPDAIAGDAGTLAEMAEDLAGVLSRETPDAARQGLGDLQARFLEVEDASRRVTDYARTECGVELDPTSPTGP